ncbi:MAG: hypothetical protein SOV43_07065, partial [Selenomonadaceae bacterium]|nr:hypothetical protein [Selenomonadaceae bacterium]
RTAVVLYNHTHKAKAAHILCAATPPFSFDSFCYFIADFDSEDFSLFHHLPVYRRFPIET